MQLLIFRSLSVVFFTISSMYEVLSVLILIAMLLYRVVYFFVRVLLCGGPVFDIVDLVSVIVVDSLSTTEVVTTLVLSSVVDFDKMFGNVVIASIVVSVTSAFVDVIGSSSCAVVVTLLFAFVVIGSVTSLRLKSVVNDFIFIGPVYSLVAVVVTLAAGFVVITSVTSLILVVVGFSFVIGSVSVVVVAVVLGFVVVIVVVVDVSGNVGLSGGDLIFTQ